MSVLKTVGIIGAISGVGLIGYYLLNKSKSNIAQQQKDELSGSLYVLKEDKPEYRKIWSAIAKYGYNNLDNASTLVKPIKDRYFPLINKLLVEKPLILTFIEKEYLINALRDIDSKDSNSGEKRLLDILIGAELEKFRLTYPNMNNLEFVVVKTANPVEEPFNKIEFDYSKPFSSLETRKIPNLDYYYKLLYFPYSKSEASGFAEIPNPTGKGIKIVASNCVELDKAIKSKIDRIAEQTRTAPNEDRRRVLTWYKNILEDYSDLNSCRDKIEKQRLLDFAKADTLSAISQEKSVLGESKKNENIYLGAGAFVLVLGVGILLGNRNN